MNIVVKIHENDNVAVAVRNISKGEKVLDDLIAKEDIPQAHKISLCDIPQGKEVIRYGVVLGHAKHDIPKGSWVNEEALQQADSIDLDTLHYGIKLETDLPVPLTDTWYGYENPNGGFAGTRNILGIIESVQCVAGVVDIAIEKMKKILLPKYPNVDDIVALKHQYGCGVAIGADEAYIPIRMIRNLAHHPNFGGVVMAVGLGCEKLTMDQILNEDEINDENVIFLQDKHGFEDMIDSMMTMADRKLAILNARKRTALPLSKLCIGLQCGGSDAFSGISANPSAGYAADMLVKGGATVMFSETTEVRDGVKYIAERCEKEETKDKLVSQMKWYDNYLSLQHVDRSANPTPGNHAGGLTNIVEKSMGSIAKSGNSPIREVLSPGECPTSHGMIFASTPANDFFCGTSQMASGIGLQVFMTGRGTPYGLACIPVIKVCSRSDLKNMWNDLIDINAGVIETGEATLQEVGDELFRLIIDCVSGRKQPAAERYGIHNDICIFNPAPLT